MNDFLVHEDRYAKAIEGKVGDITVLGWLSNCYLKYDLLKAERNRLSGELEIAKERISQLEEGGSDRHFPRRVDPEKEARET